MISDITSPPEKWALLGDSYRVEASFILWEDDNILQIPTSALFRHEEGWAVFVVRGKHAELQPVLIGHKSGLTAEVLSGLAEEEIIVTHPDSSIEDNTPVRLH